MHGKTFHMMAKLLGPERGSDIAALYGFARVADDAVDVRAPGETPDAIRAELPGCRRSSAARCGRERRATLRRARRDGAPARRSRSSRSTTWWPGLAWISTVRLPHLRGPRALLLPRRRDGRAHDHPVAGYRAGSEALEHAKTLGTAMQLTNILRDVGEDLRARNRSTCRTRTWRGSASREDSCRAPRRRALPRAHGVRDRAGPPALRRGAPRSSRSSPPRAAGRVPVRRGRVLPPSSTRSARTATTSSAGALRLSAARSSRSFPALDVARAAARRGARPNDGDGAAGHGSRRPPRGTRSASAARGAAAAARDFLFRTQRGEHWCAELESNVTITAEYVFLRQALGLDLSARREAIVRHLCSRQKADGSWGIACEPARRRLHDGGDLPRAAAPRARPRGRRGSARRSAFVRGAGGLARVRVFTRINLALFGLFPWEAVPDRPGGGDLPAALGAGERVPARELGALDDGPALRPLPPPAGVRAPQRPLRRRTTGSITSGSIPPRSASRTARRCSRRCSGTARAGGRSSTPPTRLMRAHERVRGLRAARAAPRRARCAPARSGSSRGRRRAGTGPGSSRPC